VKRVGVTELFVKQLGRVAAQQDDPGALSDHIFAVARTIAAGHDPPWTDYHPLRGAYEGYWSFKPLPRVPDFMVLCVPLRRLLLLVDLGTHKRFFTPGKKTVPPKAAALREL